MADALNEKLQNMRDFCNDTCPEPYSAAAALYFYKESYKKLSQEIKYNANIPLGRYIGNALGRKLSQSPIFADVDLVIPVPLHFLRRMRRGYNQSGVIACEVAASLGAAIDEKSLQRQRRTQSQTTLSMAEKERNVRDAFKAIASDNLLSARHILIIDDVFTSGSTLAECHRTIRIALRESLGEEKAAAVKISVAALSFVGE